MRLTNAMRDSIVESEVRKKFNKDLLRVENILMKSIESEARVKTKCVSPSMIKTGYIHVSNSFELEGYNNRERKRIGINKGMNSSFPIKHGEYSHKIKPKGEILANIKVSRKIKKDVDEFKGDLRQVLYSYTTVAKLVISVPELKSYFKDTKKAQSMALIPTETIKKVRKSLVKK